MTTNIGVLRRPAPSADYAAKSKYRTGGFALAFVGLMVVMVGWILTLAGGNINVESAGDAVDRAETLAYSFGTTVLGFGTIKLAIGAILTGIIIRLWMRVDAVKASLPKLKAEGDGDVQTGTVDTPYGKADVTTPTPKSLPIHRMAKTMWAPMLVMGYMILVVGFIISLVWAGSVDNLDDNISLGAWTRGTMFLGEGFLLAGISFQLGSILASLREGGGEVQESMGLGVRTLKMPATAKAFVGLMALGLMISIAQFFVYAGASTLDSAQSAASYEAWLGPFREAGLGFLLAGIVLALVTIGNVMGFQFDRIKEIIRTGR